MSFNSYIMKEIADVHFREFLEIGYMLAGIFNCKCSWRYINIEI